MDPRRTRPSGAPPYWAPGTPIWWRYHRPGWLPGEPETVHPMTVVRDDADALVAWIAPGTPVLLPVMPDGRSLREGGIETMFTGPRIQASGTWFGNGNIRVAPTGQAWSVWLFWNDDGSFDGYYVNLEDVHVRDGRNIYTRDRVLDIEVEPDRRTSRKDEDELVEAVRQGRYTAEQATRFEADADAVEQIVAAWGSPFCDGWETFRPAPGWPVPGLPEG
ncbi:MAG TPA: DUF402 domain-containing protein [Nocardioidaceae bacterium]|nr:DUF402 domain-containing protein [Nocardioidaceae bacterium]